MKVWRVCSSAQGFDVIGQVGRGDDLVNRARVDRPDLVVGADIRMPPTHSLEGLDAARAIRTRASGTAVMVLSAHVEVEHAMELLAGGEGIGYLLKSRVSVVEEFLDVVERVSGGGSVVDPAIVQELVMAHRRGDPLSQLSAREKEVLALMAEGRSNAGVGRQLGVMEGAVRSTSAASSRSWPSPRPGTTTGACSPSSSTWRDSQPGAALLRPPSRAGSPHRTSTTWTGTR